MAELSHVGIDTCMAEPIFQQPSPVSKRCCGVSRGRLAIAFIFLLTNIYLLCRSGGRSEGATNIDIAPLFSSLVAYDEEKCARAIVLAATNTTISSMLLSWEQKETTTNLIAKLAMDPVLAGDYVDVDVSSGYNCAEKGTLSLIAAIAQRTAMNESYCYAHKRSIWFAFREERCFEEVKQMFESHKFNVVDAHGPLASTVDVPIHLLVGEVQETLPNSPVENIALLEITHPPPPSLWEEGSDGGTSTTRDKSYSGDQVEKYSLHALFSLYRRVALNGYVALNGVWAGRQVKEFFTDDGNHTLLSISTHSTTFMKKNTQIRIPRDFRNAEIKTNVDPKVLEAWATLSQWHGETVRKFVGHVGTNPFQTYRYIEAMRHVVRLEKKRRNGKEVTINVCETGFNGGHSAMLFMSFLEKSQGINVNYFGWDLKAVGSAAPVSAKMTERFGDNFHISWGDSKITLKNAKADMGNQLCHLIVVDGEHSKNGVVNDLENFLKVAAPGAIVFGDDCAPYKRTVPKSEEMLEGWMKFVKTNQLISVANYRNPDLPSPGFVEGLVFNPNLN